MHTKVLQVAQPGLALMRNISFFCAKPTIGASALDAATSAVVAAARLHTGDPAVMQNTFAFLRNMTVHEANQLSMMQHVDLAVSAMLANPDFKDVTRNGIGFLWNLAVHPLNQPKLANRAATLLGRSAAVYNETCCTLRVVPPCPVSIVFPACSSES